MALDRPRTPSQHDVDPEFLALPLRRLADALSQWAFSALTRSPGARALDDVQRARAATRHTARRALATASSASCTVAPVPGPPTTRRTA